MKSVSLVWLSILCSFSFSIASDCPSSTNEQSDLFLRATDDIAKHQILFRADPDGHFTNPGDFSSFFKQVIQDTLRFNSDNPPEPEDFHILLHRVRLFNHLWKFLIEDVVGHVQNFMTKTQMGSSPNKAQFLEAAQQQVETIGYYCLQWFYRIAALYHQEINLLKLISSEQNALKYIKEVDRSDDYFTDPKIATILQNLSMLIPTRQRSIKSTSSFDQEALVRDVNNVANASLVFGLDEATEFATLGDYEQAFKNLLIHLDSQDLEHLKANVLFLEKILSYIFKFTEISMLAYNVKALAGDANLYPLAKQCLDSAKAYLQTWLPVFVSLYHNQLSCLDAIDFLTWIALKDKGSQFTDSKVKGLLTEIATV